MAGYNALLDGGGRLAGTVVWRFGTIREIAFPSLLLNGIHHRAGDTEGASRLGHVMPEESKYSRTAHRAASGLTPRSVL